MGQATLLCGGWPDFGFYVVVWDCVLVSLGGCQRLFSALTAFDHVVVVAVWLRVVMYRRAASLR